MKKFVNKIKEVLHLPTADQNLAHDKGKHQPAATASVSDGLAVQEDPFAVLRRYDTVFVVDDSLSMQYLWKSTRDALIGVVKKSIQYDEDGIDLHFFNSRVVKEGLNTAEGLKDLFVTVEPFNGTPTATALKRVLEPYLLKLEAAYGAKREKPDVKTETIKPLNVVVVTDGEPNPGYSPERVIVDAARRLDAIHAPLSQLGISFVQIGNDRMAQIALSHLDDQLKDIYKIRDIVDTVLAPPGGEVTTEYLLKALLGGINRKVDRLG